MKRLFLLSLVALTTIIVLSACSAATQPPAGTEPPAETMTIQVATDATWAPFEYVNEETKEIEGFDIDLMNAIAEEAGFQVEFVNVAFDPLLAGIAECQYDAAISSITITEDRKKEFLFSDSYFAAGQIVTVRADETAITGSDTLTGKTIGAQLGTTGEIQAGEIEGVTVKSYDDIGLAFQDLMNGQVDAVIADNPVALGYVGKNADKLKTVGEVFTDENYGIAVCNTKTDVLEKMNEGLAAVKAAGVIEQLTDKWLKK